MHELVDIEASYRRLAPQEATNPPAYVHIGYHKTGTTSIQQTLALNKSQLSDYYIVNQRDKNSQQARSACQRVFAAGPERLVDLAPDLITAFQTVNNDAGDKPIIISDEEFFGLIPGRHGYWKLYDKADLVMKAISIAMPNRDVRFFAYTRPIFRWLVSVHTEAVKNHHLQLSLDEFLKRLDFSGDLEIRSNELREQLPEANFVTVPMDEDRNSPFGFGYTFFKWAGMSDETISSLRQPRPENESVPADIKEIFLLLNRHGFSGENLMGLKNNILAALSSKKRAT